jgi:dethiobiotin synthetase
MTYSAAPSTQESAGLILNAGRAVSEPVLFVTGTDTGVGKTVVSAVLATAAAARGLSAGYFKPCQTGVLPNDGARESSTESVGSVKVPGLALELEPDLVALASPESDEDFVRKVAAEAGVTVHCRTSYSLALPAAPTVAAEAEGIAISMEKIEQDLLRLQEACDFVVVEGAGGLMVPLAEGITMLDFAQMLGLPIVIATTLRLGTINHTLLTAEVASSRRLDLLGLCIARVPSRMTAVERKNLELLPRLSGLEILLQIPEFLGDSLPSYLANAALQVPGGFASPKYR